MTRIEEVMMAIKENRWYTRMNGGLGYEVYCRGMEIDYEIEHDIPGIRPNKTGLWLLTLATEATFYWRLAWYLITGHRPDWMELGDDPMGDTMGRNV